MRYNWKQRARTQRTLLPRLLLASLMLTALGIGTVSALTWQVETVDATGSVGAYTSLALDSDGNPRISYLDVTNFDLKYAAWTGSGWHEETVDSAGYVGPFTSLALDGSGRPRISYYDGGNGDLKYAAYDGSSWQVETIDAAGDVGYCTSLATDSSGRPRISYYDKTNGDLKYAAYDGSAWEIETVDATGDVGLFTSLALDSADNPKISYYDQANGSLKYAAYDGSIWEIETVDAAESVGWHTSLALDGAGNPKISYYDQTNGNLKYAACDGSAWEIETVDSAGDVGSFTSLALDNTGNPHINYCDNENGHLKYAAYDGSAWEIETADAAGTVGGYTSLALDSASNPRISYYSNSDLKYARADAPVAYPNISIETYTNGQDADTPPGPSIPVNDAVYWMYNVTNTGDVQLSNVQVIDSGSVQVYLPKAELAPGESMTATASSYAIAGQYANTGTATGTYGTQTVMASDPSHYFGVVDIPYASFTANVTSGPAPLAVQFTDTSTGDPPWLVWDFNNDGIIDSTESNPTHVFTESGTYTVTLRVGSTAGEDSTTQTIVVYDILNASFISNVTAGYAPLAVQFMDTSNGTVTSRLWDFGDGANSTELNPVHTFTEEGTYTVNLTVSNARGSDSQTRAIYVRVGEPVEANFVANVTSGPAPLAVQFTDLSTSADPVTSWAWDFDSNRVIDSVERNPVHVYPAAGTYAVTLTVRNTNRLDTMTKIGYIAVTSPLAVLAVPPSTALPTDTDADEKYDDVNGNSRKDFADVVLYFNQLTWIIGNEPVSAFDYNGNGKIDFADVVWLFNNL